jgi:predicted Rdx family selenoprotein
MKIKCNYIIISFLIASLFLSVIIQSVILVNYVADQDNYIEKYCENKELPELNCNGTCHLAKELKLSVTENENSTSEEIYISAISIFSFQQLNELDRSLFMNKDELKLYSKDLNLTKDYISIVFKPPRVA